MTSTIRSDATLRPDLFIWNGRPSPSELKSWLAENPWIGTCPDELLTLWQETGGGEIFETETILGPLSESQLGDDIAVINQELRKRGLSKTYVVFHIGMLMSAVDTETGEFVELAPQDFHVRRRVASLDEWYCATLRAEYRQRYGLPT